MTPDRHKRGITTWCIIKRVFINSNFDSDFGKKSANLQGTASEWVIRVIYGINGDNRYLQYLLKFNHFFALNQQSKLTHAWVFNNHSQNLVLSWILYTLACNCHTSDIFCFRHMQTYDTTVRRSYQRILFALFAGQSLLGIVNRATTWDKTVLNGSNSLHVNLISFINST